MGKMHEVNIYCTIWALKAVKVLEFPPETKNNWLKKKVFLKKKSHENQNCKFTDI